MKRISTHLALCTALATAGACAPGDDGFDVSKADKSEAISLDSRDKAYIEASIPGSFRVALTQDDGGRALVRLKVTNTDTGVPWGSTS